MKFLRLQNATPKLGLKSQNTLILQSTDYRENIPCFPFTSMSYKIQYQPCTDTHSNHIKCGWYLIQTPYQLLMQNWFQRALSCMHINSNISGIRYG